MGRITDRLSELGLDLPKPFAPPPGVEFPFDLVHTSGGLAYVSGHLPVDGAEVLMTGRVGGDLEVEQGYEAARLTGLSIFASLQQELGEEIFETEWTEGHLLSRNEAIGFALGLPNG